MTDMQSWALAFGCASVGWACSSALSVRFREKSVQITEIEKRLKSIECRIGLGDLVHTNGSTINAINSRLEALENPKPKTKKK